MVASLEKSVGLPDVLVFHVEIRTRLEEVTVCEFLKHGVVILGVVAGNVPDLEKIN